MIDRLEQSLSNSGDPTTMSREQINAEIAAVVRSSLLNGSVSEADRRPVDRPSCCAIWRH
jgi:hypothetical protein